MDNVKSLWMKVTRDKYELPLVVEDSGAKLARKLGIPENQIYNTMSKAKKKNQKRCIFVKVDLED